MHESLRFSDASMLLYSSPHKDHKDYAKNDSFNDSVNIFT